MKAITFNPENWIDAQAEMTIDGDIVTMNGNVLEVEAQPPLFAQDENGKTISETKWDFHCYRVRFGGFYFCTIARFGDDRVWECTHQDINRTHENPFVLAAIMAANCI